MNYIKGLVLKLIITSLCLADDNIVFIDKTNALHEEVSSHNNPNITKETHPILYEIVEELSATAQVPMPRYITIYGAQYNVVHKSGVVQTATTNMEAYMDFLGDLYICYEILTGLSYEQVRGIVAIAIAEKLVNRPTQTLNVGVGVLGVVVASLYCLNKKYDLRLGELFFGNRYDRYGYNRYDRGDDIEFMIMALLTPSFIAANTVYNNLQRKVDMNAACLTSRQEVVGGIKGLCKIRETYAKEGIWSRLAKALSLNRICNILFYPVRAFTPEERIYYLEKV